jgi:hypothetical protein
MRMIPGPPPVPVPVLLGATTVQVRLAGAPAPRLLTASTLNVCLPRLSDEYVFGDVQERSLLESSEQRNPTADLLDVKLKLAVVAVVVEPFAGPDLISAAGFVRLRRWSRCSPTRRRRRACLRDAAFRAAGSIAWPCCEMATTPFLRWRLRSRSRSF